MSPVYASVRALVEGFTNPTEAYKAPQAYADAMAVILAFLLSLAIVSFIGLWLWNYSVVPLFEFARPAKSVLQILGLMIFLAVVSP
jgi:hypothetical protein